MRLLAFKVDGKRLLTWAALLAIVALAAHTRLSYLDIVEFKEDEARVSGMALALARGEAFPLVGNISSLGTTNPAIFVYLMSLPYLFSSDPAVATGFVGLLGVLAVVACYLLTRTYFGELAALVASLLFAVSPWAVMYSRKIWPQDVLPLFAVLLMSALFGYAIKGRAWQITLACVWAALIAQIHPASVTLIPLLVLVLAVCRRRSRWLPLPAGLALSSVTVIPYVLWQVDHGWSDVGSTLNQVGRSASWDGEAAQFVFNSVGARASYAGVVPGDTLLYALEGGLFVIGLGYLLVRLAMGLRSGLSGQNGALALLLLWLAVPVLLFSRHSMMLHPYYLLPVYPAQFIVIGIVLSDSSRFGVPRIAEHLAGIRARRVVLRGAIATILLLVAALGGSQVVGVSSFLYNVERGLAGDEYGLPLKYSMRVREMIRALSASENNHPVYLAATGHDFISVFEFLSRGKLAAKILDGQSAILLPSGGDDQFSYIAVDRTSLAAQLMKDAFPEIDLGMAGLTNPNMKPVAYRITSEGAARALQKMALEPLPYKLPNGVELVGWQAPRTVRAGDVLSLTVAWRVNEAREQSSSGYSFFGHLLNRQAAVWGGVDSTVFHPSEWPVGATMVNWYRVPVTRETPLGQYWLSFGSYDRDGTRRVSISGKDGSKAGDSLLLGPLKVIPTSGLPSASGATIQTRQEVWLEDQAELLGFDLSAAEAHPGDTLKAVLHWRAGWLKVDYTVFVHLVDATGRLVAQTDAQPRAGLYPTSLWDRDEYVRDEYRLSLPADLPPGVYRVFVGMYSLQGDQRLRVVDGAGRVTGDAVELKTAVVVQR